MREMLVALLMIAVALAGCAADEEPQDELTTADCIEQGLVLELGEDGTGTCVEPPFEMRSFEDPQHHCVVTKQRDRVHAPDLMGDPWVLGQSWDYSLAVDGEPLGTTELVYYGDQDFDGQGVPQHYMVGTTTRDEALQHALFSLNPMLGRVHRILYSPHESGDHADMFHFPLCEGSTWTTLFYGERFTLTAREASIDVPGQAAQPGFLIEGTSSEGGTLRLGYSPAAQWFTFIDLDGSNGRTVDMQLESMGTGYTGPAYFLRGQQEVVATTSAESSPVASLSLAPVHDVEVPRGDGGEGPYDTLGVHLVASMNGTGLAQVTVSSPDGAQQSFFIFPSQDDPTTTPSLDEVFEMLYAPGDWTLSVSGVSLDPGIAADIYAEARFVSIYDRSGAA